MELEEPGLQGYQVLRNDIFCSPEDYNVQFIARTKLVLILEIMISVSSLNTISVQTTYIEPWHSVCNWYPVSIDTPLTLLPNLITIFTTVTMTQTDKVYAPG